VRKFFFVFFFLFFLISPIILAQEATPTLPPGQAWDQRGEIYSPRLLPTSPFYFLKKWKERLELTFAVNVGQKVAKRMEFATRRLAEMNAVVKTNPEMIEEVAEDYQEELGLIEEKSNQLKKEGREELIEHVSEMTLKHQVVLLRIYENVPESAKKGLENAMENSLKGHLQAVESVSKEKKEEVLENLSEKHDEVIEKMDQIKGEMGAGVRERVEILKQMREDREGEFPEEE